MAIENLKRWHWVAISILIGAIVAAVNLQLAQSPRPDKRRGVTVREFKTFAEARLLGNAEPFVIDLVIHPAIDGKELVTGQISTIPGRRRHYEPFELLAPVPFVLPGQPAPASPDFSVRDYLNEKAPHLGYRYAWWEIPSFTAAIWFGGSVLVIGGIWPTVLSLLIGAGFGRKPQPAEPQYDLDRFGKDEPARWSDTRRELTDEDLKRLREVEAELERNLAAGVSTDAAPEPAAITSDPSQPIRTLANNPLAPAAVTTEDHEKDYRGEYYPVAHPLHRPAQPGG